MATNAFPFNRHLIPIKISITYIILTRSIHTFTDSFAVLVAFSFETFWYGKLIFSPFFKWAKRLRYAQRIHASFWYTIFFALSRTSDEWRASRDGTRSIRLPVSNQQPESGRRIRYIRQGKRIRRWNSWFAIAKLDYLNLNLIYISNFI